MRIGNTVITARHATIMEALARDLDFIIEPVNASKFDQIGYHFILGMDRSPELIAERRILYAALSKVDFAPLKAAAASRAAIILAKAGAGPLDAVADYARPIAAQTASALFGIAPDDRETFMDAARAIFGNSFLNAGGDQSMSDRAVLAANILSEWFEEEIPKRRSGETRRADLMNALIASGASDDLVRRTLGGMLVGAIDTTATCVAKVMAVLMSDQKLLHRATADRANPALMSGWCNEALRRWPHGPILLRQAARDTILEGVSIKAGDRVILWTEAAMLDDQAFPEPHELHPERPGAVYFHFGGGLHPCAGRSVNAWQIPMLIAGLLAHRPQRRGRIDWAGPFPASLPITLAESNS
ncbi:cytochrome P450 [Sphingomonas sp. TWP1-3-1]|uniref:cytochrome P450 n=1 Tax=Sphingomonas sp. TWP1-3-1 TaxID=2804612 RepID=UPI003CEAFD58